MVVFFLVVALYARLDESDYAEDPRSPRLQASSFSPCVKDFMAEEWSV